MNRSWPIIASGAPPADRIEASDGANVDDDQNDKWWTIYRLKTPPQKEKTQPTPTQYPPPYPYGWWSVHAQKIDSIHNLPVKKERQGKEEAIIIKDIIVIILMMMMAAESYVRLR